jgi:hypothetical protein
MEVNGKKIKFLTTTGRLDTNKLSREAWVEDRLVAILENINDEWLVSFINNNENQTMLSLDVLKSIDNDFRSFTSGDLNNHSDTN